MVVLQPACRKGLSPGDYVFLARALGATEEAIYTLAADPGARDHLLDEPPVHEALLDQADSISLSMELFFYLIVRKRLREEGLEDRELADYIASVLVKFSQEMTHAAGHEWATPQVYLSTVLGAIGQSQGTQRFCLMTYLGNHALFMTGVFPEHLHHRERRRGAPSVDFYEKVGQAQYRTASQDRLAEKYQLSTLYTTLADAFPVLRTSLNDLRDQYLHLGDRFTPGAC